MLLSCTNMQKRFEGLVREKIGEPSNLENEDANGEHGDEASASNISLADDTALFYKAVGGSKKGRVYGLGLEGVVVAATQTTSFLPSQTPPLQPIVDSIMASAYFKKALAELLDERDREAAERYRQSNQQMLQLQSQLSAVLNTLTSLASQSPSDLNVQTPPSQPSSNGLDNSPPNAS